MMVYAPLWILVADAMGARLFRYDGDGTALELLREYKNPDQAAAPFAEALIRELDRGLDRNAFGHTILVSEPAFLDALRHAASVQVLKHTLACVDEDYTGLSTCELDERLAPISHSLTAKDLRAGWSLRHTYPLFFASLPA